MKITDLMSIDKLEDYITNKKYVSERSHPDYDNLVIINYTNAAMYAGVWDEVTMHARGLIYDKNTMDILARPWKKFFGHKQQEAPRLGDFGKVEVTDKMDGSLIIGYRLDGKLRLSTKGSFNSEMVPVAEDIISGYTHSFDADITPLFEVIYPENRIVVDYNNTRDLFLLGGVVMSTGEVLGPYDQRLSSYNGPRTQVFELNSLVDALAMSPREGAEGLVVRDIETGNMVKIKQDDYVELHRVVTQVSGLTIWQALKNGTLDEIISRCPDELYDEVKAVVDKYTSKHDDILNGYINATKDYLERSGYSYGDTIPREVKATMAHDLFANTDKKTATIMLTLMDNKKTDRLSNNIWNDIRPDGRTAERIGSFLN